MSMLFNVADGGPVSRRKPAKKKAAPRKGSVAANLKKINANVRKAANSAKSAGNIKGSVGASAGARMGTKAKPKAQVRARVSTYTPAPVKKKAVPVKKKAAPVKRKTATYSNPGRVTGNTASRSSGGSSSVSNYSGGGGAGISTISAAPAYVEPPAPKPPTEKEWLAGDSAYNDQLSEYDRALQEYLARIAAKESEVNQDASIALQSNARNQTMGLNNNAEDFAARGMINSGLFANSAEQLNDRYGESRSAIETNKGRQLGSLTDERDTYRRENELGRGNARRQALQRMAMQFGGL